MAFDVTSNYYSGQGVVLIGELDPVTREPRGVLPIGNVTDLKIAIENTTKEHQESQTGQRGIDKRLVLQTKANLSMTVEHYDPINLARALRASITMKAPVADTYTEEVKGFLGKVSATSRVGWESWTLYHRTTGTALDSYDVVGETNWDYKFNPDAGSFWINDAHPDFNKITSNGIAASSITVGATTTLVMAADRPDVEAGDFCVFTGFAGADAADINGKILKILSFNHTTNTCVVSLNTTGKTITVGTNKSFFDHDVMIVKGASGRQVSVEALTQAPQEFFLRFEGLNTASGNDPVIIEVFRFAVDPLKELLMIADDLQQFVLEGSVLADSSRPTGSKYFREKMLHKTAGWITGPTGPTWS